MSTRRGSGSAGGGRYTPPKRKGRASQPALCGLCGLGMTGVALPGLLVDAPAAYGAQLAPIKPSTHTLGHRVAIGNQLPRYAGNRKAGRDVTRRSKVSGAIRLNSATPAENLYVAAGRTGNCLTLAEACGSIQSAITTAQTMYSGDDVTIEVGSGSFTEDDTIAASSMHSLTIKGAGASSTIVNGGQEGSVFDVEGGKVTLSYLEITNGLAAKGGGIDNAGTLKIASSTISGDTTHSGAYGHGHGGNGGNGGGIDNSSNVTVASSTISGNTTGGGSGVLGNGADGNGGGISDTLSLGATILAKNTNGDCSGSVTDEGYNIADDDSCDSAPPAVSTVLSMPAGSDRWPRTGGRPRPWPFYPATRPSA